MTDDTTGTTQNPRSVPEWFQDAKFGIFIHWGPYSVPAWAPRSGDIQELIKRGGLRALMAANPYAEWYLNSLRIKGTPTWHHHRSAYPGGTGYDSFVAEFRRTSERMNPDEWADLFARAGAKYAVMVTKHHDGFTLWPSSVTHPALGQYGTGHDLVASFCASVRNKGLRAGLYYSGVFDWSFEKHPIRDMYTFLTTQRQSAQYAQYATSQWRELIDRYAPSVLWNDIGYPSGPDVPELMDYYYRTVADGVINDRWNQYRIPANPLARQIMRVAIAIQSRKAREGSFEIKPQGHYDFRTPEYASYDAIRAEKWESTRGIGNSFALNREETEEEMLSGDELVRMLVDIVSKNGNLLLNVGPDAEGRIPEMQRKPLLALGAFLEANGEAIYGTRPWTTASGSSSTGAEVRYTAKNGSVYATLFGGVPSQSVTLHRVRTTGPASAIHLATGTAVTCRGSGDTLELLFDREIPGIAKGPAHSFRLENVEEAR